MGTTRDPDGLVSYAQSLELEIDRLRAALWDAETRLKMLYLAAGTGQKKGLDALSELSGIIKDVGEAATHNA